MSPDISKCPLGGKVTPLIENLWVRQPASLSGSEGLPSLLAPSEQTFQHSDKTPVPSGLGADEAGEWQGDGQRDLRRALWAALQAWPGASPPSPMGDWTPIETLCPAASFRLHPQDGQTQRPIMKMKKSRSRPQNEYFPLGL